MKLPPTGPDRNIELKMTPMIDVVFLLLVFFVWTSSFELPEFDLPSSIAETPSASIDARRQPDPETFDEIIIRLSRRDAQLNIELNGSQLADPVELTEDLKQIVVLGVQPPVIIDPSDDVPMEWAVQAYDAARLAGIDRVMFAAAE